MPPKCWRKLAGCTAIELLLAAAAAAGGPDYRAGLAASGAVTALAVEDNRGFRALFARCDCAIPHSTADFIAARLLDLYQAPRESLVLAGAGQRTAQPEEFVTAAGAALGRLAPASLLYGNETLSVVTGGACLAALSAGGGLAQTCAAGTPVRGAIRAAFKLVEIPHGLQHRSDSIPTCPVQAIAVGKQVLILALGGDVPAGRFRKDAQIVIPFANASGAFPDSPYVDDAIRQVLARVRR